jgi:hypothetical protein
MKRKYKMTTETQVTQITNSINNILQRDYKLKSLTYIKKTLLCKQLDEYYQINDIFKDFSIFLYEDESIGFFVNLSTKSVDSDKEKTVILPNDYNSFEEVINFINGYFDDVYFSISYLRDKKINIIIEKEI